MSRNRFGELLLFFEEMIAKELADIGVNQEVSEKAAETITQKINLTFGGEMLYIPLPSRDTEGRNKKIVNEFDGHNQLELAKKYHLSIHQIYRIIAKNI